MNTLNPDDIQCQWCGGEHFSFACPRKETDLDLKMEIPKEIVEAADKLAEWARKNAAGPWQLGPVCSRDHATRLEEREASLRFIAQYGGTIVPTEHGRLSCHGYWCAEQARASLP